MDNLVMVEMLVYFEDIASPQYVCSVIMSYFCVKELTHLDSRMSESRSFVPSSAAKLAFSTSLILLLCVSCGIFLQP